MIIAFILLLGMAIACKKSKIIFVILICFFWIILAGTYGNADEPVYYSRYLNPELWVGQTEFLYGAFMRICRLFGFSFVQFKMINAALQLILLAKPIYKYAKYPNLVLAFYSIFPFAMDVTQLRNALATSVMLYASCYLFESVFEQDKVFSSNSLKFCFFIMVATLIHTASIFWLLLLFARRWTVKSTIIFTIAFTFFFSFIVNTNIISWFVSKVGASARMNAYLSSAYSVTRSELLMGSLERIIIYAFISIGVILFLNRISQDETDKKFNEMILKFNIIILCIIPFIFKYTPEMYRMQIGLSVLNYIVITNNYDINLKTRINRRISIKNFIIYSGLFVLSISSIYLLAVRYGNYDVVIKPILTSNSVLEVLR